MEFSRRIKTAGRFLAYGFAGALMLMALPTRAASVSFFLDQSNTLPDGTPYLSVVLTENATGGVDFLVQTVDLLNNVAGRNFGIQKFGFSFSGETDFEIIGLPDSWRTEENRRMSEFGKFDIRQQGRGKSRTDSLSFTVAGVTISDFDLLMSAHVAGFEWCRFDEEQDYRKCGSRDCATSAYFSGTMPVSEVPAPTALWLFGSGLVGLAGVVRRRRN
jgi:hypothetical protein